MGDVFDVRGEEGDAGNECLLDNNLDCMVEFVQLCFLQGSSMRQ